MFVIVGQILLFESPVIEICFGKSGNHHEDNDGDVKTGKDIVEPRKHLFVKSDLSQRAIQIIRDKVSRLSKCRVTFFAYM